MAASHTEHTHAHTQSGVSAAAVGLCEADGRRAAEVRLHVSLKALFKGAVCNFLTYNELCMCVTFRGAWHNC